MGLIEEKKKYNISHVENGLHSLRTNGDLGSALGLSISYAELGRLELYENHFSATQSKRYFFKAARAWQLYQWYHMDLYNPKHIDLNPKNLFVGPVISKPHFFLLCDHDNLKADYYSSIEIPKKIPKRAGFYISIAYKLLLKGEMEEAKIVLGDAYKKGDTFTKDFALVLGGIVYKDISLIEKGLAYRRNETLRINNGVFPEDVLISDQATAWVKLARQFGLEPDISKGMIHEKILEHEDMEFEDIDEVYEAIGLEPIKRYPLRNY
jgi:hypothetical protein